MPKPRPLRPEELGRTLVGRFERKPGGAPGLADRLRQLHTKFGARSRRVFLVWTRWTGASPGEGTNEVFREVEILPTPAVSDLSGVALNPYSVGKIPIGTLRIDEVSAALSEETLLGRLVPAGDGPIPAVYEFFYEVVEDGRSGGEPLRQRYRLLGQPARKETDICWTILVERASPDRLRDGAPSSELAPYDP